MPAVKKPPQPKVWGVGYRFDAKNERAAKVAEETAAELVTNITEETREAIRALITKSINEGIAPYDAAKLVVGILTDADDEDAEPGLLGLNTPQMQSAMSYRSSLIGMGHPPEMVDTLLEKYVSRKLRERGEMIARTETMMALNSGAQEGYAEAMAEGWIPPEAELEWITTPDERLCHDCMAMSGQTKPVGVDTTFSNGSYGPPLHPRCRCSVGIVIGQNQG